MNNIDMYVIMKKAREAHLLTVNIKTSVYDAMTQVMSASAKIGSMPATLTQLVTPAAGGSLYDMHHALNMGYQNIGVLQHSLTGI